MFPGNQRLSSLLRRHRELEAWFDQLAREHKQLRARPSSSEVRRAHVAHLRRVLQALREHRERLSRFRSRRVAEPRDGEPGEGEGVGEWAAPPGVGRR